MKSFSVLIFIVTGLLTPLALGMTLDAALSDFITRAPQIKGQQVQIELSHGDEYRRFLIHEPQLQVTNADDGSSIAYGLSLTSAFPGKAFALMQQDQTKYANDRLELQAKKHDLAKMVVQAYLDCASNKEQMILQRQAVEEFGLLARSLRLLYESGHSAQAEKIGAELQLRQTQADLEMAESRSVGLCRKWHELMGSQSESFEPEGVPDDLGAEALDQIGDTTAEQARSRQMIQTAETNQSLRWWNQMPDITWGYTRNHYLNQLASPSGKDWATTYSISLTIPILFPFIESVEVRRAEAQNQIDQNIAQLQLDSAQFDSQISAQELKRTHKRLLELRDADIPLAEALVESTFAAYKIGKLGYSELMLSRKTLLDLRSQEIQTRVAALTARLRCLRACEGSNR